eukprot:g2654.t1
MGSSWAGQAQQSGSLSISETGSNDNKAGFVLSADSGVQTIREGEAVSFRFDLAPTPLKARDTNHFKWRYLQGSGCDYDDPAIHPANCSTSELNVSALGVNVVTMHHGTWLNPFIDYPLDSGAVAALRNFANQRHRENVRVQLYFTTRELSNHAAELFALRSFGEEIISPSTPHGEPPFNIKGGHWWLQEHLRANYTVGWTTFDSTVGEHLHADITDAAVKDKGASRWSNYYVKAMDYLACELGAIDGVELDGIAYSRMRMERVRKTLDKCYPAHGGIVNLHTGDMYPHSQVPSLLNYAQHLTFIDSMMIGEVFDYGSSPD